MSYVNNSCSGINFSIPEQQKPWVWREKENNKKMLIILEKLINTWFEGLLFI